MRTKIFQTILLIFLCCISCENVVIIEEPGDGILLKQVITEGEVYYEYTYNNANLILEEKSKFHYTKHNYNSANQLIQSDHYWDERIASSSSYVLEEAMKRTEWVSPENTEKSSYFSFEYNKSGRLEKRFINRPKSSYESFDIFTFSKSERIERRTSFHENKASVYDDYFYDSRGNLIKQQRYFVSENGTPNLQTTTEYEFDNKNNPYLSFRGLMIPGQNTNPNNITKETYTLHFEVDDFIEPIQVTEYNYEYNTMGYPLIRSDGFKYVYY